MKEILTDKMLQEMFAAVQNGETYGYSDDNMKIEVSPHGMSISYCSIPKQINKEAEINEFLDFCEGLSSELFIAICESFEDKELSELQQKLDTNEYRNAIDTFVNRAHEISNQKLMELKKEAEAEISAQSQIIQSAHETIEQIQKRFDEAYTKYSL